MDPLAKRRLGKSGVELPLFGFGGAPLGELFVKVSEADAEATLQAAWDAGVRYYDTAPWYGRGQREHRVRPLPLPPAARRVRAVDQGRPRAQGADATRSGSTGLLVRRPAVRPSSSTTATTAIMRAYEDCLQRLGMNRIDLLVIHDLDFWHHADRAQGRRPIWRQLVGGGWRALEELRSGRPDQGDRRRHQRARHDAALPRPVRPRLLPRGLALHADGARHARQRAALLRAARRRHHHRRRVHLRHHRDRGRARGQVQLRRRRRPRCWTRSAASRRSASATACRSPAAALQFPFGHPSVASVIPGAFRPDQVEANLGYFRHAIPTAFWQELRHERLIREDAPAAGSTEDSGAVHGPDHARRGPRLRLRGAGPRAARAWRCRRGQSRRSARAAGCPAPATPSPSTAATGRRGEYVTHWVGTPAALAQTLMLAPHLIGRDPDAREAIYDDLKREVRAYDHMGHGAARHRAVGPRRQATRHVSVARLLGGFRTRLPTYASTYHAQDRARRPRLARGLRRLRARLQGTRVRRLQDPRLARRRRAARGRQRCWACARPSATTGR